MKQLFICLAPATLFVSGLLILALAYFDVLVP